MPQNILTSITQKYLTMARAKRNGIGARCSVLLRKLHPGNVLAERFPNFGSQERLYDLITVKKDDVICGGRVMQMIFFTSATVPNESLFASPGFVKVIEEGDKADYFEPSATRASTPAPVPGAHEPAEGELLDEAVFFSNNTAEDIAIVRNQGLYVDDDNAPAPENIPTANAPTPVDNGLFPGQ